CARPLTGAFDYW
nr:immunoglobulin heavy chain junction region [Mus musculus]